MEVTSFMPALNGMSPGSIVLLVFACGSGLATTPANRDGTRQPATYRFISERWMLVYAFLHIHRRHEACRCTA
ncbi:hypothetical protein FPV67DRAFT_160235 [Lyophyllum atratum]|nr:hypothetical protein FPV67DRAFT_160235 [Lyophyllum atratum]